MTTAPHNIKTTRQRAILSLIAGAAGALARRTRAPARSQGYEVTQATVSRDIKELGLMKVPLKNGDGAAQFKYVEPRARPGVSAAACTASSPNWWSASAAAST